MRRIERDEQYHEDIMRALTPDDIDRAEIALQKRHRRSRIIAASIVIGKVLFALFVLYILAYG